MAESGCPVSELFPPGGAAGPDSTAEGGVFPLSKSSTDVVAGPLHQEELRKSLSSASCSRTAGNSGGPPLPTADAHIGQLDARGSALSPLTIDSQGGRECDRGGGVLPAMGDSQGHSSGPDTPETVILCDAERPRSIAENSATQWTELPPKGEVTADSHPCMGAVLVSTESRASSSSHVDLRDERLELTHALPVQRSHSASLRTAREGPAPRRSETSVACPRSGYCGQDAPGCPGLVCKQSMQLQQNNTVTTCKGSSNNSPTQQLQQGGVRICMPAPVEGEAEPLSCGGDTCYAPLVNHGGLEDTFAAYCHPLPIPTPAQLLPRLVGAEGECGGQRAPAHASLLTFPRLMSSVSETGLDAKRMLRCCNVDCQEQGVPYPIPPPGGQQGEGRTTREAGTMTSRGELRDVGVQTGPPESPPPHVFPEVSLAGEGESADVTAVDQKSPVKEVMWDSEGMTWEVYGASVDPEELGLAIQKHLELQIKEKAGRAAKLSRQDTATSQQSGRRRKRGGVMGSLRNPACCARSSTVVD